MAVEADSDALPFEDGWDVEPQEHVHLSVQGAFGQLGLGKNSTSRLLLTTHGSCGARKAEAQGTKEDGPAAKGKAVSGAGGDDVGDPLRPGTEDPWLCAICRGVIPLEDTAQLRGCEHAYCVNCILQWASYADAPWCPQCRTPFSVLYTYRTLEGGLSDVMVEESVCLLLRAPWFRPPERPPRCGGGSEADPDAPPFLYEDYDDGDEFDEDFHPNALRLGNRRFGESGFVRSGRMEARPTGASSSQGRGPGGGGSAGGARGGGKDKASAKEQLGRRAKRAQKRVTVDTGGAAGKHQPPRGHSGRR